MPPTTILGWRLKHQQDKAPQADISNRVRGYWRNRAIAMIDKSWRPPPYCHEGSLLFSHMPVETCTLYGFQLAAEQSIAARDWEGRDISALRILLRVPG